MSAYSEPSPMTSTNYLLEPEPGPGSLKERPWGGDRLWELRGHEGLRARPPIGESWEFSTLQECPSYCAGRPLIEVLGHRLPFLAKLVDARRPLSVQIHPKPQLASEQPGKEEAWIVLEAEPEAAVLAGLAPGVSPQQFESALAQVTQNPSNPSPLFACLNRFEVQPGSVVIIPPQTVHTVLGGLMIAEIQHPFDITYRFHDYGSTRPLHREKALETLDSKAQASLWYPPLELGQQVLQGEQIQLRLLGQGRHEMQWEGAERLLIPSMGKSVVRVGKKSEELQGPQMRLVGGGEMSCEVAANSILVVAWIEESA